MCRQWLKAMSKWSCTINGFFYTALLWNQPIKMPLFTSIFSVAVRLSHVLPLLQISVIFRTSPLKSVLSKDVWISRWRWYLCKQKWHFSRWSVKRDLNSLRLAHVWLLTLARIWILRNSIIRPLLMFKPTYKCFIFANKLMCSFKV